MERLKFENSMTQAWWRCGGAMIQQADGPEALPPAHLLRSALHGAAAASASGSRSGAALLGGGGVLLLLLLVLGSGGAGGRDVVLLVVVPGVGVRVRGVAATAVTARHISQGRLQGRDELRHGDRARLGATRSSGRPEVCHVAVNSRRTPRSARFRTRPAASRGGTPHASRGARGATPRGAAAAVPVRLH